MKHFEIESIVKKKRIIGYGAGAAFIGTKKEYNLTLDYIVDDSPQIQGQNIDGIPIHPSSYLKSERKDDVFIIIFAYSPKAILNISSALNCLGFKYGHHYVDCSFLHYDSVSRKLQEALDIFPGYDDFFKTRMLSLYSVVGNQSAIAGTWLFMEIFKNLYPHIPGDIVECGVYKGGNAFIPLILSKSFSTRIYHLFDSFEGFPELSDADPLTRKCDFADVDFAAINDLFYNFCNVKIHKGLFKNTFPSVASSQFCLVYIDCDLYDSTLYCCDFFYDRMPRGGCMFFHDYWIPDVERPKGSRELFQGVNKAVNEFFKAKTEKLLVFPETSHALIIKE